MRGRKDSTTPFSFTLSRRFVSSSLGETYQQRPTNFIPFDRAPFPSYPRLHVSTRVSLTRATLLQRPNPRRSPPVIRIRESGLSESLARNESILRWRTTHRQDLSPYSSSTYRGRRLQSTTITFDTRQRWQGWARSWQRYGRRRSGCWHGTRLSSKDKSIGFIPRWARSFPKFNPNSNRTSNG